MVSSYKNNQNIIVNSVNSYADYLPLQFYVLPIQAYVFHQQKDVIRQVKKDSSVFLHLVTRSNGSSWADLKGNILMNHPGNSKN